MGVDFYACSSCNDTYCDCGDYVTCCEDAGGCGRDWCSDDCASDDGYIPEYCKLDKDIDCGYCQEECELADDGCCEDCINHVKASCNYCRHEDYEDSELLKYALESLDMSRSDLIEAINLQKQELAKKGSV